jgi:hypothetical protein
MIRIPLLTLEEYTTVVVPSDVLTDAEQAAERDRKSSELKISIALSAINSNAPFFRLAIEKNFA